MTPFSRGIKAADVPKIKPGTIDFPESVIDMLSGGLGQPDGGWPVAVQKAVLGNRKATTERQGELADPIILEAMKMLTTVSAGADGTISEILVKKGDRVDSNDLLVKLTTA